MTAAARPGIDEYDTGSYLEGAMLAFRVLNVTSDGTGLVVDAAPMFEYEQINLAPTLCLEHSYDLARQLGFHGPETLRLVYGYDGRPEPEEVMVVRERPDNIGNVVIVAAYGYGRADFEPGEPRTLPCSVCGVETLVDGIG